MSHNAPPEYPVAGGLAVTEDGTALSAAHFVDVIERLLPLEYVEPMRLYPNSGYELFHATAAVAARVALATHRLEHDALLLFAKAGSKATGTVQFSRPTAAAGAVTIRRGSVVSARGGRRFVTTADLSFGGGVTGPLSVGVEAEAFGYEYNVRGARTTATGGTIPGDISETTSLRMSPPYGDTTFTVTNAAPTSGGTEDALSARARERGLTKLRGESTPSFRLRVRSLPDTISPAAIRRALTALLGSSTAFCFREVGTAALRGAYFDGDRSVGAAASTRDFYDQNGFLLEGDASNTGFAEHERVELRAADGTLLAHGWFGQQIITGATSKRSVSRAGGSNRPAAGTVAAGTRLVGLKTGTSWAPNAVVDTSATRDPRRFRYALDYTEFRAFFLAGVPPGNAGEFGISYGDAPYNAYGALGATYLNFYGGWPRLTALVRLAIWHRLDAIRAGGVGFGVYVETIGCP